MTRSWASLAALALVLCTATPADAHTTLKEATPGPGTTVAPPSQVVLTYNDAVILPQVVVTDAAGRRHEAGRPQAVDNKVTQPLGGPLASGVYQVGWRVVAADGHPVTGEYRFTVRGGPTISPTAGVTAPAATTSARPGATEPVSGSSGTGWWWVALGAVLAALVAGAIALVRRRSGRSAHDEALTPRRSGGEPADEESE